MRAGFPRGDKGIHLKPAQITAVLILLGGQLLPIAESRADSWQHTAGIRLSTEYETNPAMSSTQSQGLWRVLLDPSYMLTGRIGESEITTGAALQMARSSDKTLIQDRDSPSVFFNLQRPYETGSFGIAARYAESSTRDAGGADAAGRVSASSTSATRTLSGNWRNELSERSTLTADVAYEGVTYKGGAFTDYSTRSAGLRFGYAMSEQSNAFFRLYGNRFVPVGGGSASSLAEATLGMELRSESWEWIMQAGKARISTGQSDKHGSISAVYTGPRSGITMSVERAVRPSGLGGFIKTDHVRGGWHYALGEYTNVGLDVERQRTVSTTMNGDTIGTTSGAWLDHNLTATFSVRTYFQRRISQVGGLESASSNMLGLTLAYLDPEF